MRNVPIHSEPNVHSGTHALVAALNKVQPFDWAGFLRARVYDLAPQVPEGGITQGGYPLVYNDVQPDWMKHLDSSRGAAFVTSLEHL